MLKTLENWTDKREPTFLRLRLTPNRSLDSSGTKIVFLVIAVGFLLPIIPFIGSPIGTTLTIFSGLTFYLFLIMLQRNFQEGNTFEEIFISKSKVVVVHQEKNKEQKVWEGNPYWTRVTLDINNHKLISGLGPEPLSKNFNGEYLLDCCKRSKTNIKSLIMNQKNVVGIGNIYASESLYLSRVNPQKESQELDFEECKRIVSSSKKVLNEAIKVGGTTLKDFYSADGSAGYFKIKLNVYGRNGQKCKNCEEEIMKVTINQRATFYCPNCQS